MGRWVTDDNIEGGYSRRRPSIDKKTSSVTSALRKSRANCDVIVVRCIQVICRSRKVRRKHNSDINGNTQQSKHKRESWISSHHPHGAKASLTARGVPSSGRKYCFEKVEWVDETTPTWICTCSSASAHCALTTLNISLGLKLKSCRNGRSGFEETLFGSGLVFRISSAPPDTREEDRVRVGIW